MKKYRHKQTGEIVEVEQWEQVTVDSFLGTNFITGGNCYNFHLGVEPYVVGATADAIIHSPDCNHPLERHGWLPNAKIGSFVCPGDYIAKEENGDLKIKVVLFGEAEGDYDLVEEKPEYKIIAERIANLWKPPVEQEDKFVVLFATNSINGHFIRTSAIHPVEIKGSIVTIHVGRGTPERAIYTITFDEARNAHVYYSALLSFIESEWSGSTLFFPELLKRASCTVNYL